MKLEYTEKKNLDWDGINPFQEYLCTLRVMDDDFKEKYRHEYLELDSNVRMGISLHESILEVYKKEFNVFELNEQEHIDLMKVVKNLRAGQCVYVSEG